MILGHSTFHYMLWVRTTRNVWLPDPGPDDQLATPEKMAATAFEVSRHGWPVASTAFYDVTACVCVVRLIKALLSCSRVQFLVRSHQWPSFTALQPQPTATGGGRRRLFILVTLPEAITAHDGTDFHMQEDQVQPPVHRISCMSAISLSHRHEIWNPYTVRWSPLWLLKKGSASRLFDVTVTDAPSHVWKLFVRTQTWSKMQYSGCGQDVDSKFWDKTCTMT